MNIKEIEERSGLTRANIRYYEQEGLIAPARRENKYRDYSEEDLETLLRIALLRNLGFSLDEIRRLQSGELELAADDLEVRLVGIPVALRHGNGDGLVRRHAAL